MTYQDRRDWSDRFLNQVKGLLGQALIRTASPDMDRLNATDLFLPKALKIAVRVRKSSYAYKFGNEFTLRDYAPSTAASEYSKLKNFSGGPDYLLYAFADENGEIIKAWLINLSSWRYEIVNSGLKPKLIMSGEEPFVAFPCSEKYSRLLLG